MKNLVTFLCMISALVGSGDKLFKSFYKGCANETLCGTKGTGSVEMMKFRFHVYCCTGDLCNNQEYEIFEEDPTPNGVKCPSCFRLGTLEECKTNKEMNCTGSMNRCVEYRAKIRNVDKTEEDYSFKGCINSDSCRYNFDSYVGMEEIQRVFLKFGSSGLFLSSQIKVKLGLQFFLVVFELVSGD
ncbi:unnamed protein product [Ranitomeya imitator]|uniref:UPAR/Ly6 domain-containing protein n=1 Tax=Ranitomeya imitator TaxID=111125 RepID=A0ABN9LPR3_9NEOB|nr:unnamed protein product [Ranitomeya imitator]